MAIVWQRKAPSSLRLAERCGRYQVRNIWLRASYVFLHQLDLILTIFAVHQGLNELNPLMRNLLASPLQLVVAKLIVPILIAWLVPAKLLVPALVLLGLVILWNTKELFLLLL
jgi:hypothetical protein